MNFYLYIDDTSIKGNKPAYNFMADIKKGYFGFIIDETSYRELSKKLDALKNKYKKTISCIKNGEFHFYDIYSCDEKTISKKSKLDIFSDFSDLIVNNKIHIFAQTFREGIEREIEYDGRKIKNADEVIALLYLFKQVRNYFKIKRLKYYKSSIVIDNGLNTLAKKAIKEACENINCFKGVTKSTDLVFKESDSDIFLQLADFCAYSYTRHQKLVSSLQDAQDNNMQIDDFKMKMYDILIPVIKRMEGVLIISASSKKEIEAIGDSINASLLNG